VVEAHLMKTKLESEQITCYLFDENIVGLNPLFSVAVGGVKLKIRKDDIDMASLILNESENTTLKNEHGETVRCPRCLSDNQYSDTLTAFAGASTKCPPVLKANVLTQHVQHIYSR
jgi:hypothetical protein